MLQLRLQAAKRRKHVEGYVNLVLFVETDDDYRESWVLQKASFYIFGVLVLYSHFFTGSVLIPVYF